MGIIVLALIAGICVYGFCRLLGDVLFREKVEYIDPKNKYIGRHEFLLEEEQEYLDYIKWCKDNNQPYNLDREDNELLRKVRHKYKDILYPDVDLKK